MRTKKILIPLLMMFVMAVFSAANVWAIPSLGVATSTYSNQAPSGQDYVNVFATSTTTSFTDGGFIWDGSEPITIWAGMDSGNGWVSPDGSETWRDTLVYLVTNSDAGGSFSFDINYTLPNNTVTQITTYFTDWITGQLDGYQRAGVNKDHYYYAPLAYINDGDAGAWLPINDYRFPGEFYQLTGNLNAPGFEPDQGDWLFAVADFNHSGSIDLDEFKVISGGEFSPKTTSSFTVPEPATMLLLGSGLICLAAFGRKRFFKG